MKFSIGNIIKEQLHEITWYIKTKIKGTSQVDVSQMAYALFIIKVMRLIVRDTFET